MPSVDVLTSFTVLEHVPDDVVAVGGLTMMPGEVYGIYVDLESHDGGDAMVFPAFEERVNAIRGPLTIQGGPLVGAERFLNDPFHFQLAFQSDVFFKFQERIG